MTLPRLPDPLPLAAPRLRNHSVAEAVGVAFAVPRQLDDSFRDAFPHAVRGVGQIEVTAYRGLRPANVHRVKNGIPSVHPIRGDEMRALRKLRRDYPKDAYVPSKVICDALDPP
jgi:hypothetical protein